MQAEKREKQKKGKRVMKKYKVHMIVNGVYTGKGYGTKREAMDEVWVSADCGVLKNLDGEFVSCEPDGEDGFDVTMKITGTYDTTVEASGRKNAIDTVWDRADFGNLRDADIGFSLAVEAAA